jgi:hypothetical protein
MGNVTVAVVKRNVVGAARQVTADITFSNAYATSGDTITAASITALLPSASAGLADVTFFECQDTATGQFAIFDATNKKFLLFTVAGVQATNATDQSAVAMRCRFTYGQVTGL